MKISIKDITAISEDSYQIKGSFDSSEFEYLGGSYSIIHTEPFDICLSMIGNGKVQIIINTTVSIKGDCDRCLSEVTFMVPVSVDQVIEISEGAVVADDDIGPYPFIVDEDIDVDELILDEILVNFPAKILCQDDCKGLCPVCGANRNINSCGCDDTVMDPRMAQFLDVFNSFKEV